MSDLQNISALPSRRRPVLHFLRKVLRNWRERHRLPFNFAIHLVGIPLALAGLVLLFFDWRWGVGAFVLGYCLQYVGHRAEGNDVGEWAAVKRLLGLPYVGIAPRWQPADAQATSFSREPGASAGPRSPQARG
jgi:hypothetical protein